MKRSELEETIVNAMDANGRFNEQVSSEELATIILEELESIGFRYVIDGEECVYEPEEGWDVYFAEEDRKDNLRNFEIIDFTNKQKTDILNKFLNGRSFEEISEIYNITRERVKQIVAKARRLYFQTRLK